MNVTDFRQKIISQAPGVPSSVIDMSVRETLSDFFARTQTWKWVSDPLLLINGLTFYDLETLPYTRMSRILRVNTPDGDLEPISEMDLRRMINENPTGKTTHFALTATDELMMGPTVKANGSAFVEMTLTPTDEITSIPDTIISQYASIITDGALYRIFNMPQGWNNKTAAGSYRQAYEYGVDKANRERDKYKTNRRRKVAYGGI